MNIPRCPNLHLKNKYNPKIHHRRSIRLKGYDYSQAGLYFITICTKNREYFFGKINNKKMILNDAGQMIKKWYIELENKFPDIKCHEMIIMPNHFHAILEILRADLRVCPYANGASNYDAASNDDASNDDASNDDASNDDASNDDASNDDASNDDASNDDTSNDAASNDAAVSIDDGQSRRIAPTGEHILYEHLEIATTDEEILSHHIDSSLHRIVQWFKTMTTNEYIRGVRNKNWKPFDGKLWQRNYWESIIRSEQSYQRISEYIINNPLKWKK